MPTTFLLKTPIPFLFFLLLGAYAMLTVKKKREKYMYFLIPLVIIFIHAALSGAFPLNRYMLPMYPFGAIVGSYAVVLFKKKKWLVFLSGVLLVWYIANFWSTYPHYLSFTNELAGVKNQQYLHFRDSNYDWGQSLPDITEYVKKEKIGILHFSYFGRDNGDLYGLKSNKAYGSYKAPDICAFHTIPLSSTKKETTLISITNWYDCGYRLTKEYSRNKILGVVSDSFLLFK